MKKIVAFAVVPLFLFTSCKSAIPPLTLDVKTTPKLIREEADPLPLRDIVAGGPLFVPQADSANPTLRAYRKLRKARADELIAMIGEAREEMEETLAEMPAFRSQLITYLSNLAAELDRTDPEQALLATLALDTIERLVRAAIETAAAFANLEGTDEALRETKVPDGAKDNPVVPMFQYTEYVLLQKLAASIGREISYFPARAAGIVLTAKANEERLGKKVKKLTKKFDRAFGKQLAEISEDYAEAIGTQLDLAAGFDSLAAADYAFTMASLEFARAKLPEIAARAREVKTGSAVSAEDKAFYQDYARFLEAFTGEMREGIERTAPPPFLENLGHIASRSNLIPPFEGVAHAGVSDWLEQTSAALTAGLEGAGKQLYGDASAAASCVTSPWQCTKKVATKAAEVASAGASMAYRATDAVADATGAKSAFKFGQTMAGVAVDCVALPAMIVTNEVSGLYYGTSRRETALRGAEQISQMFRAWDEGKPGSVTLRGGVEALAGAEQAVGEATQAVVGGALGAAGAVIDTVTPQIVKDAAGTLADGADWLGKKATGSSIKETFSATNASWATGKLAEMTSGMVTGLGKGMMQLANPDSSPAELAEGTLNVVGSFVGGSKCAFKASQVGGGVKKLGQETLEKGASYLERTSLKLQNEALSGQADDIMKVAAESFDVGRIQQLARTQSEIYENMMRKQLLERQEKSIARILGDLKDKSKEKFLGNLDEAKEGAKAFATKEYDLSLAGLKDAAGDIAGRNLKDYADNIIGGKVDGIITDAVKGTVESLTTDAERQAIAKVEKVASPVLAMGLDPQDPAVLQAMKQIEQIRESTKTLIEKAPEAAKAAAAEQTREIVKQELATKVTEEADKRLTTPVRATGSFSGDYRGSVAMTLTPGGGPVSGTVTTKYGSATIRGSVSDKGALTASVSGGMSYDYYPDGKTLEKRHCTLSASMTGSVRSRSASGSYRGSCAEEGDSGSWTASW